MKIVTSCFSRFHIFDQAQQLQRLGVLQRLVTGYPKFMTRRWSIPDEKVDSLLINFLYGYAHNKLTKFFNDSANSRIRENIHNLFSSRLPHFVPDDADIFIGLSSFCYEAIAAARERGIVTIVDHGSLHEQAERNILLRDCEKFGFSHYGNWSQRWLLEKQEKEFNAADHIFVLSNIAKRTMVENGIDPKKVFINSCGVNVEGFSPGRKDDGVFRIIQCSAVTPRKGIHYLLQAFNELQLPNSELWIIGAGLESASVDPAFMKLIKKYSMPNVFFKGAFPQSQLSQLYWQGSLSVLPSLADGFGMVVPQAMACGLPVIVTDHVGAADIVDEGGNGFVIPAGNVEALKEKILYFYENPEAGKEMGNAALKIVKKGYTWNDYGDRLVNHLENIKKTG